VKPASTKRVVAPSMPQQRVALLAKKFFEYGDGAFDDPALS